MGIFYTRVGIIQKLTMSFCLRMIIKLETKFSAMNARYIKNWLCKIFIQNMVRKKQRRKTRKHKITDVPLNG